MMIIRSFPITTAGWRILFVFMSSSAWPIWVSTGVRLTDFWSCRSHDFDPIVSAKRCGDGHVYTLPLSFFHTFLVQRLCAKASKVFHRRFGGFKLDCFNSFSLMRKSFRDSSGGEKKSKR